MKRMLLILILATPILGGEPLTKEEKNTFVEFYKKQSKLDVEPPEKSWVNVMFVDLDGDGIMDALVSNSLTTYEEAQADWSAYKCNGKSWVQFKSFHKNVYEEKEKLKDGAFVFGRPGEFYQLVNKAKVPKFLILQKNYDKLAPEGIAEPVNSYFFVDNEGVLREQKIDNLKQFLADNIRKSSKPADTLKKIEVETYSVSKKD